MIYLDNAATTLKKPPEVEQAVLWAFRTIGNAGRGAHAATLDAARIIYDTRERLARLFHIPDPEQIAFTSNGTEALNVAIQGLFQSGDHVITTVCEHNSVLRPLYRMEREGVEVTHISADADGILDYGGLERAYQPNTKGIVITHASNLTGNITDLERVHAFAKAHGILLVVDAAQTAGSLPIDVCTQGIDVLCFTGHKGLLGPQGTGGLYVRKGVDIRPLKVGGSGIHSYDKEHPSRMPAALEAGTFNGHGIAGLNASIRYLEKTGIEQIRIREMKLLKKFQEGISGIPGITVYGNPDLSQRVATVALNIGEYDSASVSDWLWEDYEIAVRAGAHCAPLMHEALGTKEQGSVRFSISHYNTEQEIDQAVQALRELAE